jgi:hypothetical protein
MSNDSEMFGQLSVTAIMRMGSSIGILSFVASLARPGGNITGLSALAPEISANN